MTELRNRRHRVAGVFDYTAPGSPTTHKLRVEVGFDHQGNAREVFAGAAKHGTEFDCLMDHSAIMLSKLMQHGHTLKELSESLIADDGLVYTQILAILQFAMEIESDYRDKLNMIRQIMRDADPHLIYLSEGYV